VGDSPHRSDKESAYREHSVLAPIEGELYPYVDAPTRISGECWLFDTLGRHHHVPFPLFTLSIYIHVFTFLELPC
jgi:hypothetical protein